MRSDNRLSRMLHVLIHMDQQDKPLTSDDIALMLNTNPVVVRRTMAGLKEHGCVHSVKGHRGGWTLIKPLEDISLLDVYQAIGEPPVFSLGFAEDHPQCLVEQAVNTSLTRTLQNARDLLMADFARITLRSLAHDFEKRMEQISAAHGA
ncbi:Rrf2 family transcriptional regulator [Undibacterium sp. CY18W]|uniref:Rrf2 family transcriptional regulator n=1 Tax=Undibacterium hunanense TaxID=2762292 RepID=A0ABR6ZWX6_9BURK|nr:Rrf2 family transcriptional regulator [Undibacterium hunanense]MBC3920376.1 Rrf2 family transcriptional regulator [Undibacterium hunanense]